MSNATALTVADGSRRLLDTRALAERIGVRPAWLRRHRKALVDEHGFPEPLPGFPRKYDPAAVDAWLDRHLRRATLDRDAVAAADAADDLDARAQAIAGGLARRHTPGTSPGGAS